VLEEESANNRASNSNSNDDLKSAALSVLIRPLLAKPAQQQDQREAEQLPQAVPCRIVFTDLLIQKLKERHGASLIPLVHKLQMAFITLSNFLAGLNFQDMLSNEEIGGQKQKVLG